MNFALILACLGILGKGMLGILLAILVLWAMIALLNRATRK